MFHQSENGWMTTSLKTVKWVGVHLGMCNIECIGKTGIKEEVIT